MAGDRQEILFIFDNLYGVGKPISDFMEYLGTGADGLSTGKQLVVFIGPPASGKSSSVTTDPRFRTFPRTFRGLTSSLAIG